MSSSPPIATTVTAGSLPNAARFRSVPTGSDGSLTFRWQPDTVRYHSYNAAASVRWAALWRCGVVHSSGRASHCHAQVVGSLRRVGAVVPVPPAPFYRPAYPVALVRLDPDAVVLIVLITLVWIP